MKISVAIPCYEYKGKGVECLEYSFNKLLSQTFADFQTVISDHSVDNEIQFLCEQWSNKLNIKYIRNEKDRGNPAQNSNNAMLNCDSEFTKFLCQDDYLIDEKSLQIIVDNLDDEHNWFVTGYVHTHDRVNYENYRVPYLNDQIFISNTIGTPSCATFRNFEHILEFDENLSYCYDCEYYYRYILKHGLPKIITANTMANYLWDESITSAISQELIAKEENFILRKHRFINND
jgi:glycosyltransferase involved in cell wall biosynthesis